MQRRHDANVLVADPNPEFDSDGGGRRGGRVRDQLQRRCGVLVYAQHFDRALTHTGQVTAGAKAGPRGVVASANGSFVYVANINDDNIYEFSINQTNGTLTPLATPSVSNGNATEPDELAMNGAGTLLWVTGRAGTVTAYTVDTTTGKLTKKSSIDGFNTPFGIAVHPTLAVIYVSDLKTGLIQPMSYNTKNGLLSKNFPAVASSDPNAKIPAALTIDPAGAALSAPDKGNGEVPSFAIDGSGALTPIQAATNGKVGVVDRQGVFVYTANSADGTVAVSKIKGACVSQKCAGTTVSARVRKGQQRSVRDHAVTLRRRVVS